MAFLPQSLLDDPIQEYKTNILPSYTYKIDKDTSEIIGHVDGIEAVKQAVFLYLNTERFKWFIFPDNDYGVEFDKYRGKDLDFVIASLEYEIKEALSIDTRIVDIKDFEFEVKGRDIYCTFTVVCIFGSFDSSVEFTN